MQLLPLWQMTTLSQWLMMTWHRRMLEMCRPQGALALKHVLSNPVAGSMASMGQPPKCRSSSACM